MYTKDITDILSELVTAMEFPVFVFSVVRNGDQTQTLTCSNIYHVQEGFVLSINGKEYRVTAFSQANETITVSGVDDIEAATEFNIYGAKFFHGTPIATDVETGKIVNAADKTPMIWLWENFREKKIIDLDPVARKIDVELYFLTQSPTTGGFDQMVTEDIYSECIQPMKRLVENFVQKLIDTSETFSMDFFDYDTENYTKFGVMARAKGATKSILMDKLSGIGMKCQLKLWHKEECDVALTEQESGIDFDPIDETEIL